jgi:hypothetical protein
VLAVDDRAAHCRSSPVNVNALIDQGPARRLIVGEARAVERRSIEGISPVVIVAMQPCLEQPSLEDFAPRYVGAVAAALEQLPVEWAAK